MDRFHKRWGRNRAGHGRHHRWHKPRHPRINWTRRNILTIICSIILAILILYFIPINGWGKIVSVLVLLALLWFVGKPTYHLLRYINRINLMSDLSLWLLRILSVILIILGIFLVFAMSIMSMITSKNQYITFVWIIAGIDSFIIGAFGLFRFKRRHQIIGIWK